MFADIALYFMQNKADKTYKKLVHLESKKYPKENSKRGCCLGICGRKAERVDQYEKKLEDVEGDMRAEQLSLAGKVNIMNWCHWFRFKSPFCAWFI